MQLAIKGGKPVREQPFPAQNIVGPEEREAVERVLNNGILTGYQGNWSKNFYGGPEVRKLEEEFADKFESKHAIACNSATSGIIMALGAVKDKLKRTIVTPYSMTCSASAPLIYNSEPLFADIERDYYCLDTNDVKNKVSSFVNAILPVSLFGQPYDVEGINKIAKEHGLWVIEDAAQALGSKYKEKFAGTLGDIGIFSLNQGKHLTAGEGGIVLTDNDDLALKCRMIMNHAEAVQHSMHTQGDYSRSTLNLVGMNLRMTELTAAVARAQLSKFDQLLEQRMKNIAWLYKELEQVECLELPKIRKDCTHTYYVFPMKYIPVDGITREMFVNAVKAELSPITNRESEGVFVNEGYIEPIYKMPLFGNLGGVCPECERQQYEELIILHRYFAPPSTIADLKFVAEAFQKVWEYREELLPPKPPPTKIEKSVHSSMETASTALKSLGEAFNKVRRRE